MTLEELKEAAWYRFLKVLYFTAYFIVAGLFLLILGSWGGSVNAGVVVGFIIGIIVIFEFIRRAFFYVVTGKSK